MGRREVERSDFVGHQAWKAFTQWGGGRWLTKSWASRHRVMFRREERVGRPARQRRRSCGVVLLGCSPTTSRAAQHWMHSRCSAMPSDSPAADQATEAYSNAGRTQAVYLRCMTIFGSREWWQRMRPMRCAVLEQIASTCADQWQGFREGNTEMFVVANLWDHWVSYSNRELFWMVRSWREDEQCWFVDVDG